MFDDWQPVDGRCFLGGQWVAGAGDVWQRHSPVAEVVSWSGCGASTGQIEVAIQSAREALASWALLPLQDRIDRCQAFARHVDQHGDDLARWISVETGKPLWEAKTEVGAVIGKVDISIEALQQRRWTTRQAARDHTAVTRYRPHGVMLVIGPFNLPAHLPGGHLIPALLAGNTVVFKPSQWTPGVGQWLVRAWQASGLPDGVLNLLHGGAEVATAAADHAEVAGVLFTGSRRAGVSLHRLLAGQPEKLLALELGGNNPLVVHDPSDCRDAAITAILSAYITSGQRCTCARRLIISGKGPHDQIVDQLRQRLPRIRVGLPWDDPQPFMGPLVHRQAAETMLQAEQWLQQQGGESVVPLRRGDDNESLLHPGLIAIERAAQLADDEHFGPLLVVQQVDDLDEAIALANRTRFGLAAGFIGRREQDFEYFLERVHAGVINRNRQTTGASGRLPFGGTGHSGNHQPSGYFASDYCSYPVASLESDQLLEARQPLPGLDCE